MEHRLISSIGKALGWEDAGPVHAAFARGRLPDADLPARLMTPYRLLDLVQRRHLSNPQLRCYARGDELHPSAYLNTVVNRRRQGVSQADMAALGRVLDGGGRLLLCANTARSHKRTGRAGPQTATMARAAEALVRELRSDQV
ncbi:hypothetical protein [Streptomyces sp. NPDC051173]|uniref:hypothetical protein n=1 Tax=Streptomyces sp. NPDC051173 TaxID=3155164 RepID=UPI00344DE645